MAATSHHGEACMAACICMRMCVLCAVKPEDKASRINVRDRTSFSIETFR